MTVTGEYPGKVDISKSPWAKKTKMLVSASTGPMSKQNRNGEMSGMGMEQPSGSLVSFDGGESISLVKSRKDVSRPRFCVACDYIDLLRDGFWEYFRAVDSNGTFEMKPFWEKIHPNLDDDAKKSLIESVTLYLIKNTGNEPYHTIDKKVDQDGTIKLKYESDLIEEIQYATNSIAAIFLSIKFDGSAVNQHLDGFEHYDYESSWNIQVGIYGEGDVEILSTETSTPNTTDRATQESQRNLAASKSSSWRIMRHKKHGEVPSFKLRKRIDSEYYCNLPLKT